MAKTIRDVARGRRIIRSRDGISGWDIMMDTASRSWGA
jgi:hypothetical protein